MEVDKNNKRDVESDMETTETENEDSNRPEKEDLTVDSCKKPEDGLVADGRLSSGNTKEYSSSEVCENLNDSVSSTPQEDSETVKTARVVGSTQILEQKDNKPNLGKDKTHANYFVNTKVKSLSAGEPRSEMNESVEINSDKFEENNKDSLENSISIGNDMYQEGIEELNKNIVFVSVGTFPSDKDDKSTTDTDVQAIQNDECFKNNQPEEDPILGEYVAPAQLQNVGIEQIGEEQRVSEQLCAIPDTEGIISQENKIAAAAAAAAAPIISLRGLLQRFQRKCSECEKKIHGDKFNLSWETMEFCTELCLSKYQKKIGSYCVYCQMEVRSDCLGKYCVRVGYDLRQFCGVVCLEKYKKSHKLCSYCEKEMPAGKDHFLVLVYNKGEFKEFCTQKCMEKYDIMNNHHEQPANKTGNICSVCHIEKPITIEYEMDKKINLICGESCFIAFKFVNKISPGKCNTCKKYFDNEVLEENSIYYDNCLHNFCSKICRNIYIIANRKIVACSFCKVKKYNFSMIKRSYCPGPVLTMCSLNCLSLHQAFIKVAHSKEAKCEFCQKTLQTLYHLTMTDATIRNFCSYACATAYQTHFLIDPITLGAPEVSVPVPTGAPKRILISADVPTIPIITSVQSLATISESTSNSSEGGTDSPVHMNLRSPQPPCETQIKDHLIIKPTPISSQRNVATMCGVMTSNKGFNAKPSSVDKEVQTDVRENAIPIPIPVPIYVPLPMGMYSMPYPVPFPFPLPIPVPIFIPTTRNSASGVMKEIKKIQMKTPTDPFEAELLTMAELVADTAEENTVSKREEQNNSDATDESNSSPEPVDTSNTFRSNTLRMATEANEPASDLEGALAASTVTAFQREESLGNKELVEEPQRQIIERRVIRRRRRQGCQDRGITPSKRRRRVLNQREMSVIASSQPSPLPEPVEKSDANMCLKYTLGVNAWKQWVTTKNAELERTSCQVKLFKPEILQLTADELNYSLCLFVNEIRKPNGQEYAPDTIYYVCLGIQLYLSENGRTENIFFDANYGKFTDCFDELAKKFSIIYNDSQYIVTRVEEEHLWESKQLGAYSPQVLLNTLLFFNTKHFKFTTVDEHMELSFACMLKQWKHKQDGSNEAGNVLLRFYPPLISGNLTLRKNEIYEQQQNVKNPVRCPINLHEFYLSKCPQSVKERKDVFYLLPERYCLPDSPVWYSAMPLPTNELQKLLHRIKIVKEINIALLPT